MVPNSDLQKWQAAASGINESGQKDLTQEEWTALMTLNNSLQHGNFASVESRRALALLKNNYRRHDKNRILQMHLYNFIVLCEEYCSVTNVDNTATVEDKEGSEVKNRMSNSDLQKWQTTTNGINASGQKDLTREEWSALSTLNSSLSSGNFGSDQSRTALALLKHDFGRHGNNRILQTHLWHFITLCEQYGGIANVVNNTSFEDKFEKEHNEAEGSVIRNVLLGAVGQFKQSLLKNLKYAFLYLIVAAALTGIIYVLNVSKQMLMPGYTTALVIGALAGIVVLRKNQRGAIREKLSLLGATAAGIWMYTLKGGPISGGYAFLWTFVGVGLILSFLGKNKPKLPVWLAEAVPAVICFLAFERLGGAISGFGAKEILWGNVASVRYMEAFKLFFWFCLFQSFANNSVFARYRKIEHSKNSWSFYVLPVAAISLLLLVFLNPANLPVFDTYKSKLTIFSQPARASADVFDVNGRKIGSAQKTTRSTPLLSKHIPGYLATAYDFSYTGDFDRANITFDFDAGLGNIRDTLHFRPRIYYFNETDGTLEELPNQKTGDNKDWVSVTATTGHFSTYILLNKVEFDAVWNTEIRKPQVTDDCRCEAATTATGNNFENFDVVFAIDETGSMRENDPNNLRIEAAKQFIDLLAADKNSNRVAIYGFETSARQILGLTPLHDKEAIKTSLNTIHSIGNTSIYSGFEAALREIETNNLSSHSPVIILMTDGMDNSSTGKNYSDLIVRANNKGVTAFVIGLGNVDETLLRRITDETGGGLYYYANNADALPFIFKSAESAIVDYVKDTNGDGISDYYAKLLSDGTLRLSNGSGQFMGIDWVNCNPDYDGDGLLNGEELIIKEKVINGITQVYVYMASDPTDKNDAKKDDSHSCGFFYYSGGYLADKDNDLRGDFRTEFTFSTDYFVNDANIYNHDLAIMSLQLSMAAFGLHKEPYGNNKTKNIKNLLCNIGFQCDDIDFYGYDKEPKEIDSQGNSIAATIARRSLDNDTELVVIAVRGGEYKEEWGGNFYVGDGDVHEGFRLAKETVIGYFNNYHLKHRKDLNGKKIKLWITGYSRGSAVANLLGAHFNEITNKKNTDGILGYSFSLKHTDIYTYCFATPNVSINAKLEGYDNIFCIISPFDPVPNFPFKRWGFKKFGRIKTIPKNENRSNYIELENEMLKQLMGLNSSFDTSAYLINKFKVHKGNTGSFLGFLTVPLAIYDLGPHDEGREKETMDKYLKHLIDTTLYAVFGTQDEYVNSKQDNAVNGAMAPDPKKAGEVKGFMGALTAALGLSEKVTIITGNWSDFSTWGTYNDDIATLGPSDKHLERLIRGNDIIGMLSEEDRFPAVYNFGEGSTNFKADAYDKMMIEYRITRKQAVQKAAQEAKNNSYAVTSGHYPELYLAWLKSLQGSELIDETAK